MSFMGVTNAYVVTDEDMNSMKYMCTCLQEMSSKKHE